MIVQEPVQATIWHCLNHYDYTDAVFLSERLYAEVKTEDSLFLLATAYYRNGQKNHAYHTLKERTGSSSQCRYLFGICAYDLEKYAEAEAILLGGNKQTPCSLDDITTEYEELASFVYLLLGKIALKTERRARALETWRKALKLNPFLWSAFELLCKAGDSPNPTTTFQINSLENLSMCHGSSLNNIESLIIANTTPNLAVQESAESYLTPPHKILTNFNPNRPPITNCKLFTPEDGSLIDDSPLAVPLCMSGLERHLSTPLQPSFGQLIDTSGVEYLTPNLSVPPTLTELNVQNQTIAKRMRAQVDQLISRKESLLQNCKPVFSQSTNVSASNKTPSIQPSQNVRRSSRLFSNSYSVKENNKSPNRGKFATPKSPSRKTKQRMAKVNLNKNATYTADLNTRNKMEKEKSETVTSESKEKTATPTDQQKPSNHSPEAYLQQAVQLQKHSAEGLMCLLRDMGQAYLHLTTFSCKQAVEAFNSLPPNQLNTAWVYCMLGLAHFEMTDYETSAKYFSQVHTSEPHRLEHMDIYSTLLWHLQKEVSLSALAQDLVALNKNSPVTWCVSGNCFSLHKEHDTAIKFFQRATQVDPNFPYAYTLLGHEYITTEELDKAMSCFRNAIRLEPRHYNAWFGIGTIYAKQERYRLAEMNYARALSINPQSSVILCHIGVIQHCLKETEKALETFNRAIAANPKSPLCKFHRGSIYFTLGRHAEALKELEELKEIVPKESLVYYLIGKVHKKLGNTDLALMHFSWATDLDPKGANSQINQTFDPSIGHRSTTELESPASPTAYDYDMLPIPRQLFGALPDDSEDSF